MKTTSVARQKQTAQAIIETVVGLFLLVPVVLLMVDLGALVLGVTANDALAKNAARAAAGAVDPATGLGSERFARYAALNAVRRFVPSQWLQRPDANVPESLLAAFSYNGGPLNPNNVAGAPRSQGGLADAHTRVVVKLPVPMVGLESFTFVSKATLPIVALEAPDPLVTPVQPAQTSDIEPL